MKALEKQLEYLEHLVEMGKACLAGKELQFRRDEGCPWADRVQQDDRLGMAYQYRIKPEPLEFWVNEYDIGPPRAHSTQEAAIRSASPSCKRMGVHMREVTDDES